jgi:hypothetical protein
MLASVVAFSLMLLTAAPCDAQARRELGTPRAPRAERTVAVPDVESASSEGRALGSPFAPTSSGLLGEFDLEITAGTVFPLALGLGLRVGHQSGVFFDVWAGGVPSAYATLAGEAASAYGVSDGPRGLLEGVLDGAGLLRLGIGVRPIRDLGIELTFGYSMLHGAPTLPRATLEAATGQSLRPAADRIGVMLTVHALHLELGYGLVLFDHLLIRATVGAAIAVGASFRVDVPESMRMPDGPVEQAEHDIASGIPGRVFMPTARLEAGVHF